MAGGKSLQVLQVALMEDDIWIDVLDNECLVGKQGKRTGQSESLARGHALGSS